MATVIEELVRNAATEMDAEFPGWAEELSRNDIARLRFLPDTEGRQHAAWLAEIALRLGTPEAEEARVEAGARDMSLMGSPL